MRSHPIAVKPSRCSNHRFSTLDPLDVDRREPAPVGDIAYLFSELLQHSVPLELRGLCRSSIALL